MCSRPINKCISVQRINVSQHICSVCFSRWYHFLCIAKGTLRGKLAFGPTHVPGPLQNNCVCPLFFTGRSSKCQVASKHSPGSLQIDFHLHRCFFFVLSCCSVTNGNIVYWVFPWNRWGKRQVDDVCPHIFENYGSPVPDFWVGPIIDPQNQEHVVWHDKEPCEREP